jgi:hypothetical protein
MKALLPVIFLSALSSSPLVAAPVDSRPFITLHSVSDEEFRSHGLWLLARDMTHPPTNIVVHYMKGGDESSLTRRTLFLVGLVGQEWPVYCVSSTSERDVTLILEAFLEGYTAAQGH